MVSKTMEVISRMQQTVTKIAPTGAALQKKLQCFEATLSLAIIITKIYNIVKLHHV